jgi:hypothetical protein
MRPLKTSVKAFWRLQAVAGFEGRVPGFAPLVQDLADVSIGHDAGIDRTDDEIVGQRQEGRLLDRRRRGWFVMVIKHEEARSQAERGDEDGLDHRSRPVHFAHWARKRHQALCIPGCGWRQSHIE